MIKLIRSWNYLTIWKQYLLNRSIQSKQRMFSSWLMRKTKQIHVAIWRGIFFRLLQLLMWTFFFRISVQLKVQVGICAHRQLRSDCASDQPLIGNFNFLDRQISLNDLWIVKSFQNKHVNIYLHLFVCLFVLLFYVPSQQLWSWRDGQFT